MAFQDVVTAAQKYFPGLQVKYKDQSTFMKVLGTIMFFNPSFMTDFITTIGNTVYFPTASYIGKNQNSSSITLLHELVHINDSSKLSKPVFSFLYLLPQIIGLLLLPLFFFVHWYIVLPLVLLFAAPIPAYFRMNFEKRAYISQFYTINKLSQRFKFDPQLESQKSFYLSQFKGSYYYFMWPFNDLVNQFNTGLANVQAGKRPYEDPVFDILDDLVTKI